MSDEVSKIIQIETLGEIAGFEQDILEKSANGKISLDKKRRLMLRVQTLRAVATENGSRASFSIVQTGLDMLTFEIGHDGEHQAQCPVVLASTKSPDGKTILPWDRVKPEHKPLMGTIRTKWGSVDGMAAILAVLGVVFIFKSWGPSVLKVFTPTPPPAETSANK